MPEFHCLLFDLDGTLVDTAPDLIDALNQICIQQGHSPVSPHIARTLISHGSIALLRLCFGETVPTDQLTLLRQSFTEIYRQRIADRSRLFPGFTQILTALEARQLPWGVVTNKPVSLAASLLRHLGLESRSCCLIGGDSLPVSKPDPAPLLQAALLCKTQPQGCAYIGDARADILAARGAGMQALVAGWGYLDPADNPSTWGADRILGSPTDLLPLIDSAPALNGL